VDRSEGKRPLVTCKRISEYNIKMDFQEILLEVVALIDLAQAMKNGRILVTR
jgi:hypothetical protein